MKKYTFEVIESDDGKLSCKARNDGFHAFELLGFLHWKCEDIRKQLDGEVGFDIVTREVVKD